MDSDGAGCRTLRWSSAEAASRLSDVAVGRDLFDVDILVLELAGAGAGASVDAAVLDALHRAPCVTVGIGPRGPLAAALDVVLDEGGEEVRLLWPATSVAGALASLNDAVGAAPGAARTLVQVLRTTETVSVLDGLVVESLAYSMLLGSPGFRAWLQARPRSAPKPDPEPHPKPEPEPHEVIVLARDGDTLDIVLNRPHVHNAFNAILRDSLVEALGLPVLDPTIESVVVRGAGPTFCSGGDLTEFGSADDVGFAHAIRTTNSAGAAIARLGDRITAYVHGRCVGAGLELPSFAGTVVADPATTFRLPEVEMGLIPGAGGTVSIPRRIGRQRAALIALTGVTVDAPTALRWGLVDRIEPVAPAVPPPERR